MRLDLFLCASRLIRRRTEAKRACDLGLVTLNGRRAKASTSVAPGDVLALELAQVTVKAEVVSVPSGQVRRRDASDLVRVIEKRRRREELFEG